MPPVLPVRGGAVLPEGGQHLQDPPDGTQPGPLLSGHAHQTGKTLHQSGSPRLSVWFVFWSIISAD